MQTDSWYLERRIYVAVGINLSIASALSLLHSPWWLAFTAFVGGAMVWFAGTGIRIMANGLYWLGAEPRLAPMAAWAGTPRARPDAVGTPRMRLGASGGRSADEEHHEASVSAGHNAN